MSRNQALEMSFFNHYDHPAAWPQRTRAQVFSLSVCPGPRQDWVNFQSSQEGNGQDPGVIPYHLSHVVLFPCFPCVQWCRARFHVVSNHLWMVCLSGTLSYLYHCCYCSLSYPIAVSTDLFLSQHVIFTFLKPQFSSILSQGKERWKWVGSTWSGMFQWEHKIGKYHS